MKDVNSEATQRVPLIFLFSGPSGSGKATIMQGVIKKMPSLEKVVTFATRAKRADEQDGVDYHFISREEFQRLIRENRLLEYEQVYGDHYYGSPRIQPVPGDADRIIELDYRGQRKLRAAYQHTITIFIMAPSFAHLVKRINQRCRVSNLSDRLQHALEQMKCAAEYDYILINEDAASCIADALAIIRAERIKRDRQARLEYIRGEIMRNTRRA